MNGGGLPKMAINWDLYSTRLKIDGNTFKERQVNTVVNAINNDFTSSPSYFEVSINGNTTLTGVQIVDNSSNESNKIDYIRKIIMKPSDSISVGDIVDWNSKKWLVISAEQFSDIYWYGMIQECNNTLKYYKNSVLFTVPCVIESQTRLYSLGQDSNKYISTVSDEIIVYIPNNTDTENIKVDDVFKIGRRNYKVLTVQDVIMNGLLVLKMEVTVEEPIIEEDNPIPENIISISPIDSTINKGGTKIFNAIVTIDGVINDTERTIWLLTNKDGSYLPYCTMSYDNRTCTLVASNNAEYVGKVVNLKVVLESNDEVFVNKEVIITSFI